MRTTPSPKVALQKDVNFLRIWFSSTLSAFGDSAFFIVMGWFVVDVTQSQFALGTTLTLAAIPRLVLMLMGGVLADRVNRKLILIGSLAMRALLLLLFASLLALSGGHVHVLLIYALSMLFGTVDAFYWPASGSILPQVVERKSLAAANSWIQIAQQLSMFVGPLVASALLLMHHFVAIYIGIAVLYIASLTVLLFLRTLHVEADVAATETTADSAVTEPVSLGGATQNTGSSVWRDLTEGVRYVLSIRILLLLMVISLVINLFFMGPINIGLPVWVHSVGWRGSTYGGFEASLGVGAILGGLACTALGGMRGHFRWLGIIGSLMGVCMACLALVRISWFGMGLMAAMGVVLSLVNIPIITYIQTIVAAKHLGRVMSLLSLMSMGLVPVSYAVSSFVLQQRLLSVHAMFVVCGAAEAAVLFSCILFRDFRQMELHPLWQAATPSGQHSPMAGEATDAGA